MTLYCIWVTLFVLAHTLLSGDRSQILRAATYEQLNTQVCIKVTILVRDGCQAISCKSDVNYEYFYCAFQIFIFFAGSA